MALAELNQLVHLVDLARLGEFVTLERVTPSAEEQREVTSSAMLRTVAKAKKHLLRGAADQLRKRARRIRDNSKVQQVFQEGVVKLRKTWRIIAPNHGKVRVPLQVGEALAVDCSYGSAGGTPVPYDAAAGMRHKHPWLVQLICGEGGKLEAGPRGGHPLMTMEVQVIAASTGICLSSASAEIPKEKEPPDIYEGLSTRETLKQEGDEGCGGAAEGLEAGVRKLTYHLVCVQHSVYWEEVFEAIKAEALANGKQGWVAHRVPQGTDGSPVGAVKDGHSILSDASCNAEKQKYLQGRKGNKEAGRMDRRQASANVVHIGDDEVRVKLDHDHLLDYRLVAQTQNEKDGSTVGMAAGRHLRSGEAWRRENGDHYALCRLALLCGGSLLRLHQKQRQGNMTGANERGVGGIPTGSGRAWEGLGRKKVEGKSLGGNMEASLPFVANFHFRLGCMLRHYLFQKQALAWSLAAFLVASCNSSGSRCLLSLRNNIFCNLLLNRLERRSLTVPMVAAMAAASRSLQCANLPFSVHWMHLGVTYPASSLQLNLGQRFRFTAALQEGAVTLSALPGLYNHADQRQITVTSAHEFEVFLLSEACRQILLTFGDIAAGWKGKGQICGAPFTIDLVSQVMHLLPRNVGADGKGATGLSEKCSVSEGSNCFAEVHVALEHPEGGLRIKCVILEELLAKKLRAQIEVEDIRSPHGLDRLQPEDGGSLQPVICKTGTEVAMAVQWGQLKGSNLLEKFTHLLSLLYTPVQV
ncbi:unnamed protein product [Discosporangium mesarthrocarpum]